MILEQSCSNRRHNDFAWWHLWRRFCLMYWPKTFPAQVIAKRIFPSIASPTDRQTVTSGALGNVSAADSRHYSSQPLGMLWCRPTTEVGHRSERVVSKSASDWKEDYFEHSKLLILRSDQRDTYLNNAIRCLNESKEEHQVAPIEKLLLVANIDL